jgi:hypothetical protein
MHNNLSTLVTGTRPARFGTQGFCRCFVPSSAVSCKREVKVLQCGPLGTTQVVASDASQRRKSIAMVACPRFAGETGRLPDAYPLAGVKHPSIAADYFVIVVGSAANSNIQEPKANVVVGSGCTVRRKIKVRNPVGHGMYPRS